jgi:hypothetical protein
MGTVSPFPTPENMLPPVDFASRLSQTLARITHPEFAYNAAMEGPNWFLRVSAPTATCNVTGDPAPWAGRKWRLSEHMTAGEIAQTALMATLAAIEHEAREVFKVDGVSVFDPHYDLNRLVRFRSQEDATQERD